MAAKGVLRTMGEDLLGFWCPGCEEMHMINVDPEIRPAWGFNGDYDRPTFKPSINVTGVRRLTDEERERLYKGEDVEPTSRVCHSFVTDGNIQFLHDCTHALAGQTHSLQVPGEGISQKK